MRRFALLRCGVLALFCFFFSFSTAFGQVTIDTKKDSVAFRKHWEAGYDLLGLVKYVRDFKEKEALFPYSDTYIDNFENFGYSVQTIFFRRLSKPNRAFRFRIGLDHSSRNPFEPSHDGPDKVVSTSGTIQIGREWRQSQKRFARYCFLDISEQFLFFDYFAYQSESPGFPDIYLKRDDRRFYTGVKAGLGFQFQFTKHLSIQAESHFSGMHIFRHTVIYEREFSTQPLMPNGQVDDNRHFHFEIRPFSTIAITYQLTKIKSHVQKKT